MITNLSNEQIRIKFHFDKHIWEGWEVGDFVRYIENDLDRLMEYGQAYAEPILKTKDEIKQWIKSHLPYTLKALVPVTRYFIEKYNGMPVAPWYNYGKDGKLALK